MDKRKKIAVLGGDGRQLAAVRKLYDAGYEVAVWGLEGNEKAYGGGVRCGTWEDAVICTSAVILPLPASVDGVRLNCPMYRDEQTHGECSLKLHTIVDKIQKGTLIIGGRFTPAFLNYCENKEVKVIDYYASEELQIKNSIPTSEGAIAIAMQEMSKTLYKAKAGVIGFGRIGKTLARMLSSMGAEVTVAARKNTDLTWAEIHGYKTVRIDTVNGKSSLEHMGEGYDVIFNTVPYWLFDRKVLENMDKDTLIIDLASAPGGVDSKAATEAGVRVIWALSLPGKYAPDTAGAYVGECICDILKNELKE